MTVSVLVLVSMVPVFFGRIDVVEFSSFFCVSVPVRLRPNFSAWHGAAGSAQAAAEVKSHRLGSQLRLDVLAVAD